MKRIEASVVINRPIEEVWAFMLDPFNVPRVGGMTLGVRLTSPGPIGVGSTAQGRMVIFGLETRLTHTVTEWEPPHAFAWAMRFPGVPGSEHYTLEATADGTKVVRVHGGEPQPALKPLWWFLGLFVPFLRRGIDAQNQRLKRVLESGRG